MFLSVENIETLTSQKFISREAFARDYPVYPKRGDVLMTRIGDIGTSNVVETDDKLAFYVSLALLKPLNVDSYYLDKSLQSPSAKMELYRRTLHIAFPKKINKNQIAEVMLPIPRSRQEQEQIGALFRDLDTLITLHQREPTHMMKEGKMPIGINGESLFCDYYSQWISVYKEGAIREVTMGKYRLTQSWLAKLIPDLKIKDLDRTSYQQLINGYAEHHERQTTMDFHHQLKGAILDAVDEGLIPRDPTRKAIIKGKQPRAKKIKYLNQFELHAMLGDLDLSGGPSWDWLILIVAKTGLRFSEALGLTPEDFDFAHQTLSVNKTWDYKNGGGFVPTKNASSVRKVQLDWQLIMQLSGLLKDLPPTEPIFVKGKVYNSTANSVLARHCKNVGVPTISVHGLRHTHASLLLFAGVSIASVSRRLGHASMTTTQETYLHVIQELENKDIDIVMRALSTLI